MNGNFDDQAEPEPMESWNRWTSMACFFSGSIYDIHGSQSCEKCRQSVTECKHPRGCTSDRRPEKPVAKPDSNATGVVTQASWNDTATTFATAPARTVPRLSSFAAIGETLPVPGMPRASKTRTPAEIRRVHFMGGLPVQFSHPICFVTRGSRVTCLWPSQAPIR